MKILISGAGIAGPTLAYWLAQYGFSPTIVERSPHLRTGGYIIDFWGAGFDVAERMGLLPELSQKGYRVREVRIVNRDGERVAGFHATSFAEATGGRFISLPRGELAAAIFGQIDGNVETIFHDSIASVAQNGSSVHVTFERGRDRDFDLVVGADGLHSALRALVFGRERRFERYLGYKVAAFEADGYRPRDELVYVMYTQVGQQVSRFSMNGDRTMFLFTMADDDASIPFDSESQKAALRQRFEHSGWECAPILRALDATSDLYFDRVSQIRMGPDGECWTRGRVALIGDAAFCVSLLAGEGSGLAMVAAYILAGELRRANGDYAQAFSRYKAVFAPFLQGKQKAAQHLARAFAPRSSVELFLHNQFFNLLGNPWIVRLAFARGLKDNILLPEYEQSTAPRS